MGASPIREISKRFEIGGHTMNHVRLRFLSRAKASSEITEGKEWLENVLGQRVISFCYPSGSFNARSVALVKQAGFMGARTCLMNLHRFPRDPFLWGVSTHACFHSRSVQFRHAVLEGNLTGIFNLVQVYRGATDWQTHFRHALDYVELHNGIAHLLLHSWEIDIHNEWLKLELVLKEVANRKMLAPLSNGDLFKLWKVRYAQQTAIESSNLDKPPTMAAHNNLRQDCKTVTPSCDRAGKQELG